MHEELPRSIGPYEITGRIGKGGMGQVYKAVQPSLNRVVAVKVLPPELGADPERVERFNREAQAVALLNHPNVVQIIDKDQDGDLLFFVMEYVPGCSLDAVLKQRRLSLHESLRVFKAVCSGLEAAHDKNITHRDLNPRNILVSEDLSTVKVADFGISRVDSISLVEGTLSTSQLSLGSLHYMAPEQARDMTAVDQRSDIYSLGVVLYEMLTGRLPVGRFSLPSQLNGEVPPELDPIVLKCLASSPEDRYPAVGLLQADLARLEDQLRLGLVDELRDISRSTTRIFTRSTRSVVRHRGVQIAFAAGLALALAAAGAFFLLRALPAAPPASPSGLGGPAAPEGESRAAEGEIVEVLGEGGTPGGRGTPDDGEAAGTPPASADPQSRDEPERAAAAPAPAALPPARTPAPAVDPALQDLRVARNQLAANLHDPALATLRSLIAEHPRSPAVVDAYLLTAEVQAAAGRPEEAMATYVEVRSRFAKDSRSAEAGFRLGELVAASGDEDRLALARQTFGEVVERAPTSPWAPRALAAQAAVEREMNIYRRDDRLETSVPAALVTLRYLVESYPTAPQAEKALWDLGGIYEETRRFELAAETFSALGARFPETEYDTWWRAARLLDRRLDQTEKALAAYQRVTAESPHFDDAQKRITRLKR